VQPQFDFETERPGGSLRGVTPNLTPFLKMNLTPFTSLFLTPPMLYAGVPGHSVWTWGFIWGACRGFLGVVRVFVWFGNKSLLNLIFLGCFLTLVYISLLCKVQHSRFILHSSFKSYPFNER